MMATSLTWYGTVIKISVLNLTYGSHDGFR